MIAELLEELLRLQEPREPEQYHGNIIEDIRPCPKEEVYIPLAEASDDALQVAVDGRQSRKAIELSRITNKVHGKALIHNVYCRTTHRGRFVVVEYQHTGGAAARRC